MGFASTARRLLSAVKGQLTMSGIPPDDESDSNVSLTELVARDVDRNDTRKTEIPKVLRGAVHDVIVSFV